MTDISSPLRNTSLFFAFAFAAAIFLLAASAPPVRAQATPLADATALKPGSVEGRILLERSEQPAKDAEVRIDNTQVITRTGADGRFRLTPVGAGTHTLSVALAGHVPVRVVDVVVRPGQTVYLDTLQMSSISSPGGVANAGRIIDGGRLAIAFPYKYWTVNGPLLAGGAAGAFDEIAVKNPSIVFHEGRWHLFFTSKPRRDSREFKTALGYVSAPTLEGLATAPRVEMRRILGDSLISPQVFYFEPQKLWYLIGHISNTTLQMLEPVYSTNPDITNVEGWSAPRHFQTNRKNKDGFWIDFWVICDEQKAHLFYSEDTGVLYRMETPIAEFPEGFANATEQPVATFKGRNARGEWQFYNSCHVYHVKSTNKYLALFEGAYAHPTRRNQWDGRNRFLMAATADRLEGPWRRVEASDGEFIGESRWLFDENGNRPPLGPVSHPELVRAGYDQRLQIEDYRLRLIFQTFDATEIEHTYDYHALPWRLMLMRNY